MILFKTGYVGVFSHWSEQILPDWIIETHIHSLPAGVLLERQNIAVSLGNGL